VSRRSPTLPAPTASAGGSGGGDEVPLHPGGAVRAAMGALGTTAGGGRGGDDVFRALGLGARRCDLGDQGLYLAEELVDAAGWHGAEADREALGILTLALLVVERGGASRLPLATSPPAPLRDLVRAIAPRDGEHERALLRRITDLARPQLAGLIGQPGQGRPLIVDDGALYSQRNHVLECQAAAALAARLTGPTPAWCAGDGRVDAALAAIAARPSGLTLTDDQVAAVRAALTHPLTVITGGAGTGKTAILVTVVRALARLGVTRIALAAATGKAANRMTEVLAAQLAALTAPPRSLAGTGPVDAAATAPDPADLALAATPPPATTVHRLLGAFPGGFRHHARSPLPVEAVIIDEASMVDLDLFAALLAALPAGAALVLVGDASQLPSVQAGQVLAELVRAGEGAPWLTRLGRSFRADGDDPRGRAILDAAADVRAGDSKPLLRRLERASRAPADLTFAGIEWVDPTGQPGAAREAARALWRRTALAPEVEALALRQYEFDGARFAEADEPALRALLAAHQARRVLTVTRGQPTGAHALARALHEAMLERTSTSLRPDVVPGEPVIMTANDYERGVFNGDQGVIARVRERGVQHYRAVFRRGDQLVPFPLEAVRGQLELAWALTVHKSQGSEFDEVVIVLPDDDLPLTSHELLYTALTRARRGAVVVGSAAVIGAACRRASPRYSGLGARLARALRP
jgi:exodeoxyribonuclease V alpha subunit